MTLDFPAIIAVISGFTTALIVGDWLFNYFRAIEERELMYEELNDLIGKAKDIGYDSFIYGQQDTHDFDRECERFIKKWGK